MHPMDSSVDFLVQAVAIDMQHVDQTARGLAVEIFKRIYEDRREYCHTSEQFKSTEGTTFEKERAASRAEATKLLLNVWNNEPRDPRYRRKPKADDGDPTQGER